MTERLYTFLSGKYNFRDWVVLVYDGLESNEGLDQHYIDRACDKSRDPLHFKMSEAGGKNVLVAHIDPNKVWVSKIRSKSAN